MLECVINISEGQDEDLLGELAESVASALLDVHTDPVHNRSVFTLAGANVEQAARDLATGAIDRLDIRQHQGAHPRLGVIDVVPFVPLGKLADADLTSALAARDSFVAWMSGLGVPCFAYGPDRTLPEVRKRAWLDLVPTAGPDRPHPTAGACCVGARNYLIAYNLWIRDSPARAGEIARQLRNPSIRALGLDLDGQAQVAFNLVAPWRTGPEIVYDLVAERTAIDRAELVGLVPRAVLDGIHQQRWAELDLAPERTIEHRLALLGLA